MQLSPNATAVLGEFARQQGVTALTFNENGLIPLVLDGRLQIAIGYSPANDSLFFFSVLDEKPDPQRIDPWALLSRPSDHADRRTRIALDAASGALLMLRDLPVAGLDYQPFANALDQFVLDVAAELKSSTSPTLAVSTLPPFTAGEEDFVMIRL